MIDRGGWKKKKEKRDSVNMEFQEGVVEENQWGGVGIRGGKE